MNIKQEIMPTSNNNIKSKNIRTSEPVTITRRAHMKKWWQKKTEKPNNWLKRQREKTGLRSCGARIFFRILAGEKIIQTISLIFLGFFGVLLFIYFSNIPLIQEVIGRELTINEMAQFFNIIFLRFLPTISVWFLVMIIFNVIALLNKYKFDFDIKVYLKFCAYFIIPYIILIVIGYITNPSNTDFNTYANYIFIAWSLLFLLISATIIISWAFFADKNLYITYGKLHLKDYLDSYPAKIKMCHVLLLAHRFYENKIKSLKDNELVEKIIDDLGLQNLKLLTLEIDEERKDYKTFNETLSQELSKLENFESPLQKYDGFKLIMSEIKTNLLTKGLELKYHTDKKTRTLNYYSILIAFVTATISLIYSIMSSLTH